MKVIFDLIIYILQLIYMITMIYIYGPLDNVGRFKLENYMCGLKKMVRKNDKPLHQIIKRCQEHSL